MQFYADWAPASRARGRTVLLMLMMMVVMMMLILMILMLMMMMMVRRSSNQCEQVGRRQRQKGSSSHLPNRHHHHHLHHFRFLLLLNIQNAKDRAGQSSWLLYQCKAFITLHHNKLSDCRKIESVKSCQTIAHELKENC